MSRSLSDLLCDDFAELANHGSEYVASEESIRVLLDIYQSQLSNISFVHIEKLQTLLAEQRKKPCYHSTSAHYQYFVEFESRSLIEQRKWRAVHYCALDLFVRPGLPSIAFVADHFKGFKVEYVKFKSISELFNIQFVIAGGKQTYQADNVHCPIFTLKHLLLTAEDPELPLLLSSVVGEKPGLYQLNWNQLSPNYLIGPQSFSMITDYVDSRVNDKVRKELAFLQLFGPKGINLICDYVGSNVRYQGDSELERLKFDKNLSPYLKPVHEHLSADPNYLKLRNKFIKYCAADFSGRAVMELEKQGTRYTEAALIKICYKRDRFRLVRRFLDKAYEQQLLHKVFYKKNRIHPFFEFAFYHANALEKCLENEEIQRVLTHPIIAGLVFWGLVDPNELLEKVTIKKDEFEANVEVCNHVNPKLNTILGINNQLSEKFENKEIIYKLLIDNHISKTAVLELLTSPKTNSFCRNNALIKLFLMGHVDINWAKEIFFTSMRESKNFESLSVDKQREYLKTNFKLKEIKKVKGPIVEEDEIISLSLLNEDRENILPLFSAVPSISVSKKSLFEENRGGLSVKFSSRLEEVKEKKSNVSKFKVLASRR